MALFEPRTWDTVLPQIEDPECVKQVKTGNDNNRHFEEGNLLCYEFNSIVNHMSLKTE